MDQLVQIATGEQSGFDLKGLLASMAAAAVNTVADAKVSYAGQGVVDGFNAAIDMLASHVIDNMPLDMEDLAGTALGTVAGTDLTEAGDYLKNALKGGGTGTNTAKAASQINSTQPNTDRYVAPDSEAKRINTSQWSNVQNP